LPGADGVVALWVLLKYRFNRVNSFFRLLRYAKPYKGRLAWAVLAMVIYAVASALSSTSSGRSSTSCCPTARAPHDRVSLIGLYFVKGVGSYFSGYLMEDVGQRVVMDVRDQLYGTSSASRPASSAATPSASCCRACRTTSAGAARDIGDGGDLARETLALVGYAVILFYIDRGSRSCA
jgi:ABC-type multidrug transport system fused ATPase/permease subunit